MSAKGQKRTSPVGYYAVTGVEALLKSLLANCKNMNTAMVDRFARTLLAPGEKIDV
jgi:hypothetical protein